MRLWFLFFYAACALSAGCDDRACSDNGNENNNQHHVCGNHEVEGPEECDDGNVDDGDGCSAACRYEPSVCPDGSVLISSDIELGLDHAVCMDRYEASRSNATNIFQGDAEDIALSRPGVIPWYVNPMSLAALETFERACQAAGKRLCSKAEWFAACTGSKRLLYSFGNTFDRNICNCVDTFCEEYCQDHPEIQNCNMGDNCGYTYYSFHVVPTASFVECTNEAGAFDICGNVWEVVPSEEDFRGYEVRGGAYNCASASQRLQCSYNATWTDLYAGFRCCQDIE